MEGKLSPAALRALRRDAKLSAHSLSGAFTPSDAPAPTLRADTPSPHAEPDPMPETKPGPGEGVCQRGCGLSLSGDAEHCCVDALRSVTDALEGRSAGLEHQVRMARLRWNRREQWLLARVTALQNEAQLAALQYQQRLHQYMVHIGSIAEQVNRYCQDGSRLASGSDETSDGGARAGQQEQLSSPQVNGKELSKSSHEESAEAFRAVKEPVVVQVIRRTPSGRPHGSPQEIRVVDVCTQTDITFEHIMALAKLRPSTPPVPDVCPFLLSDSCHSLHTMDQDYYGGTGYLSPVPADGERTEDFEYEEVELCRVNSQEKLGLTLCYRTDEEEDVAIYVSEISPNSIAARDGRIREGDRILQINGQDVQNRQEAVAALSSDECTSIVLLVARPETQLEEAWLDDEHSEFLEQLKMEMLEEQQREEMELAALQEAQEYEQRAEEDKPTCSTLPHHKDGILSLRDRIQSSEHNVLAHIQRRLSQCLRDTQDCPAGSTRLEDEDEGEAEGDRFQQLLELKCQIHNGGEYDLFYSHRSTIECSVAEQDGMQHELRMLNEELRSIELECQNIMQAHNLRKNTCPPSGGQSAPATRHGSQRGETTKGKLTDTNDRLEKSDKDSSSAYNTAESSRSTPLAMDRSPEHSLQRMVSLTNQRNLCTGLAAGRSLSSSPVPAGGAPLPGKSSSPELSQTPQPEDESSRNLKACVSLNPYFSPSHSSQQRQVNIPAHARHYQSYMHLIQQRSAVEYAQSQLSLLSVCKEPQRPVNEPKMEWKVKIRSDGTRYITKRPVRDKILRERALKIKEERSGGMTTDDDAMSEMKMGRYWSKEERKQHLVRAKEQRKRREFMQRSRLESLRENPQSSSESRKEVSIIELSHRKMMKKRNKKILDNWMTIQELMTHGAKAPEGAKVHNAFLSVTTV
ncbi:PDZ domain-containing RING finger protein 4-like isoform X1 [Takifugu flavidus]|uniref:PDZ domain-containing RING finger protein 4-like isoform X1 n=1 Tax=Takifugu flavidus TaxID=433684 RepID=UPI00254490BB|nr:PDZ domain-containing RING finger protein 4-like isoform X1 [Takifugu flavidus]